jgi:hypothetical protein
LVLLAMQSPIVVIERWAMRKALRQLAQFVREARANG